jgi:outer membrane beta-barrel protein
VLALALPASAQEEGGGEEGAAPAPEEPLPGEEGGEGGEPIDGLPGEPPAQPTPSDEALKPKSSDVAPTTPVLTTGAKRPESQETWKDIVVIPRKYFLKRRRVELMPFFATTMNDNLIQHFALGGEVNYFLTDILSIGVAGMYYFKNVLDQEFYTRYHFHRVPSLNKYKYTATLNFAYVPIYGKFTLFNKSIMHYEVFATAGVGISGTEIIPRDYRYDPFSNNFTLTFPVGLGGRLFLTKWLAIQAAFRSYILLDKFEPTTRTDDVEADKGNASTDIVNNMMFNIGFSFFLPTSFKYTTFR